MYETLIPPALENKGLKINDNVCVKSTQPASSFLLLHHTTMCLMEYSRITNTSMFGNAAR